MSSAQNTVNLLLPEGLSPPAYHALARRLLAALGGEMQTPEAEQAVPLSASGAGSDYVTLSQHSGAPPENMPVLNDFTWVLSVPVPEGVSARHVQMLIERVADAADVQVEEVARYGVTAR